jgi:hypothetical protein
MHHFLPFKKITSVQFLDCNPLHNSNIRNDRLDILLWEDHGSNIDHDKHIQESKSHPVVAIFAGLIVKKLQGKLNYQYFIFYSYYPTILKKIGQVLGGISLSRPLLQHAPTSIVICQRSWSIARGYFFKIKFLLLLFPSNFMTFGVMTSAI